MRVALKRAENTLVLEAPELMVLSTRFAEERGPRSILPLLAGENGWCDSSSSWVDPLESFWRRRKDSGRGV